MKECLFNGFALYYFLQLLVLGGFSLLLFSLDRQKRFGPKDAFIGVNLLAIIFVSLSLFLSKSNLQDIHSSSFDPHSPLYALGFPFTCFQTKIHPFGAACYPPCDQWLTFTVYFFFYGILAFLAYLGLNRLKISLTNPFWLTFALVAHILFLLLIGFQFE